MCNLYSITTNDAGDFEDAGRSRDLDDRASGRGPYVAAAAFGWDAADRRPRRQGGLRRADPTDEWEAIVLAPTKFRKGPIICRRSNS